jgi:hypothetical protein
MMPPWETLVWLPECYSLHVPAPVRDQPGESAAGLIAVHVLHLDALEHCP